MSISAIGKAKLIIGWSVRSNFPEDSSSIQLTCKAQLVTSATRWCLLTFVAIEILVMYDGLFVVRLT